MIPSGHATASRLLSRANFSEAAERGLSAAQPPLFSERPIAKGRPTWSCIRRSALLSHPVCVISIDAFSEIQIIEHPASAIFQMLLRSQLGSSLFIVVRGYCVSCADRQQP